MSLASKELERVFKGTVVNRRDMKARSFLALCLDRRGLIIQSTDPARPFLSYVNQDWESKDDSRGGHLP